MAFPQVGAIKGVVALGYGTVDIDCDDPKCPEVFTSDQRYHESHLTEVPALFLGSHCIWHAPAGTYWDHWGDGGASLEEVVADKLRDLLMAR